MSYYQFAASIAKMRKSGFDSLTDSEKWEWHADVYGWRRVRLGAPDDERTSPVDPNGEWFDPSRVAIALDHYRGKTARPAASDHAILAEARTIENQWARDRGYDDFEDYRRSERIDHSEACKRLIISLPGPKTLPKPDAGEDADPHALLKALGVKAKEYNPTPEELRQARIALGIEEPDDPPVARMAAE
jgi:hypothetical protein